MAASMMTWAGSPGYGVSVILGPTQAAVLRYVMDRTEGGRRPYLTLSTIADAIGKPVSSVHDALGRLRALGLIGCAARMGRTGGHRLWRVGRVLGRRLDPTRRRRAIARIIKRWSPARYLAAAGRPDDIPPVVGPPDTGPDGSPLTRRPSGFRQAMQRAGFRAWWTEEPSDAGSQTMTEDELLSGITDALTISGWWWMHIRRSDQAIVQGMQGFPDVFAIHPERGVGLAWELKAKDGRVTLEHHAWMKALKTLTRGDPDTYGTWRLDVRVVRPQDYDDALGFILHSRSGIWGA